MDLIRILYVDPSSAFRRLAVRVLRRLFADDIQLLADGDSWPLTCPLTLRPHAVLFGLGAHGVMDPQQLTAIQNALPDVPIVVLGHLDDEAYRLAALEAGAAAFVAKDALGTDLIPVLRRLVR